MRWLARSFCFALLLASCGGSGVHSGAVSGPLLEGDEALFDGGVEYVDDPEKLTGRWRDDWHRELGERIERSDAIFRGEVSSTRVGVDGEGHRFVDIRFEVEEVYLGKTRGAVEVRSSARDPGHRTIERRADSLFGEEFLVFVKWVREEDRVRGRFHLVTASRSVVSAVGFDLGKR